MENTTIKTELNLSERSYLADIIARYFIDMPSGDVYDLTERVTKVQRGQLLRFYYKGENRQFRELINQIQGKEINL